jgi:2-oxoisovalerate dehydrogenase E1 component
LVDLQAFAKSLGADFYTCDGNDYLDVYQTYRVAVARSRRNQTPAIIWVQNLSRLNGHSSASDYNFDFKQHDPLRDIGAALVAEGILREEQILRRRDNITRNRFFDNHDLGEIGREVQSRINELWEQVAQEPEPTLESMLQNVRLAYSQVQEPAPTHRPTVITIKGAIRAGLRDNIEKNPRTLVTGQDVAKMGGVNKATMGLWDLFPDNVTDAPINEPLIISSALGFALHEGAVAFPEIQFGDYFRSAYHWVYYIGGLLFTSGGKIAANINIRLPVDPIGKGAIYHSASLDAELAHIPGLTVLCFSNTRDAYGMIRSAAEYPGPVVILEPKILYGVATGDAFENEPPDQFNGARLAKEIFHGAIPDIPKDFRVPLGKAAVRREGKDLTLLTWGLAHYKTVARGHDHKDPSALDKLVESGIDVELIDLRTLVPPDMATVLASVEKTGRLLVVHEDRVFAGLGSEIVRQTRERFADRIIASEILGMEPVSGIPQHQPTERAVTVNSEKIVEAGMRVMGQKS